MRGISIGRLRLPRYRLAGDHLVSSSLSGDSRHDCLKSTKVETEDGHRGNLLRLHILLKLTVLRPYQTYGMRDALPSAPPLTSAAVSANPHRPHIGSTACSLPQLSYNPQGRR